MNMGYDPPEQGQHAYPMPDPVPMHQQVLMLGKEVAELRAIIRDYDAALAQIRAVLSRELGI